MLTTTLPAVPKIIDGQTVPAEQWQLATEYMNAIHGADTVDVAWRSIKSIKQVRAAFRDKIITSFTTATVDRGESYAAHPDNAGRETGGLPYGVWLVENFLIFHNGQVMARLYVVDGSLESTYAADGADITRDEYLSMIYKKPSRSNAGCVNIKIQNLTVL